MHLYKGIIIHHSACSSVNGKGYDYFITEEANVISATEPCDSEYIHLCLEGDFSQGIPEILDKKLEEQLFVLQKLIVRLYERRRFTNTDLLPHTLGCPGAYFPWSKLVISLQDRYH